MQPSSGVAGMRRRSALVFLGAAALAPSVFGATGADGSLATVHRHAAMAGPKVSEAALVADINAVRKTFRLPPGKITNVYRSEVVSAANALRDPILNLVPPRVFREDGVWGAVSTTGDGSTLDPKTIVHSWVYEDGWRGSATINIDCTGPQAPGCNGHRRAILRAATRPGATLSIDAYASTRPIQGQASLSIAAILSWST